MFSYLQWRLSHCKKTNRTISVPEAVTHPEAANPPRKMDGTHPLAANEPKKLRDRLQRAGLGAGTRRGGLGHGSPVVHESARMSLSRRRQGSSPRISDESTRMTRQEKVSGTSSKQQSEIIRAVSSRLIQANGTGRLQGGCAEQMASSTARQTSTAATAGDAVCQSQQNPAGQAKHSLHTQTKVPRQQKSTQYGGRSAVARRIRQVKGS